MQIQERDYQIRIHNKLMEAFQSGVESAGIVSPTGSGKTIMAMKFVKWLEDEHNLTTNWVAMRRNLLTQARETNDNFFGIKNINFVSMFDKNPPKSDAIVLDELQHASTQSFNNVSDFETKFMLGASATPWRTDKLKLPFSRIIQDAGIHKLIEDGWLTQYHHWCCNNYNPHSIAKLFMEDQEKWGKSVAFFSTVEQCHVFKDILADNGIRCEVVKGSTHHEEKERQLDAFDNNEYQIIANVAILVEGFDSPDLQTVFCRDASKLPTIQMCGRGFRTNPGKTHCNIVQSKHTKWQFTRTARPKETWVQVGDQWVSTRDNGKVNRMASMMKEMLVNVNVTLPKYLKKTKKRKISIGAND